MEEKGYLETPDHIQNLFTGFLNGTLPASELPTLFKHFGEADEQELRQLIKAGLETEETEEQAQESEDDPRLDVIFGQISQRIGITVQAEKPGSKRQWHLPLFLRYAATVLLVAGVSWLAFRLLNSDTDKVEWKKVTTRFDRKKLVLSDGTAIWLGPQSSFEYPQKFGEEERSVRLSGEAFFEVAKDASRPFSIQSGKLVTRVIGTSFNIDAYPDEQSATVIVLTGKVAVAAGNSAEVQLASFQQAEFQEKSGRILTREYPAANNLLARREGNIRYDGAGLKDIINDIRRISAYRIVASEALYSCVFYGEMKAGEDPVAFLQDVCRVNNLTLEKHGTSISITGKGCSR